MISLNISKQTLVKRRKEKTHQQEKMIKEKTQQQRIEEFSFYIKFAMTLFASISAISILNEENDSLKYPLIFLTSLSALISIVFKNLLNTPKKMMQSHESMKKKKVIFLLIVLLLLSITSLYLFIMSGEISAILVGLFFVLISLVLSCIPLITKFILR